MSFAAAVARSGRGAREESLTQGPKKQSQNEQTISIRSRVREIARKAIDRDCYRQPK